MDYRATNELKGGASDLESVEAKPLVIEVDGVKTPDYELIEELYGEALVEEMKEHAEYSHTKNENWKIEVLNQGAYIKSIVFATYAYCYIYEISLERKRIIDTNRVSLNECIEALGIMNSFQN
jgi:hypothetical protein